MPKSKHDNDEYLEEEFPYARPSMSVWIAAAAVALSFFVIGGFIKTYLQLEALREESRREISDLRDQLDVLRSIASPQPVQTATGTQQPRESASRVQPLPQARPRIRQEGPARMFSDSTAPQQRIRIPEIDDVKTGVTYTFGRTAPPEEKKGSTATRHARGTVDGKPSRCQVVAVNNDQKRAMVEGGRDVALQIGSRLELSRQGRWIGDLRVLEVYDTLSACEVLHSTLTPEPGDIVRLP